MSSVYFLAPMALALTTQRLLAAPRLGLAHARAYRAAFLFAAALSVLFWAYRAIAPMAGVPLLWLGVMLLGAFGGALLATALETGLYEDSFPPASEVQEEVRQRHLEVIGRPAAGPRSKRLFDITLALAGLMFTAPIALLALLAVWFEDPGPVLFIKNSVGKGGINFRQIKLRTMVRDAEAQTGPVASRRDGDPRVLKVGYYLRKAALDEWPQLANILVGRMSFVGPRPLRTVVIRDMLQTLPQFAERHAVQPGIAGLSQVRGGYYISPLQRLRFDRLYAQRMSLRLDMWIISQALLIVLWLRWRRGTRREKMRRWTVFR